VFQSPALAAWQFKNDPLVESALPGPVRLMNPVPRAFGP